MNADWDLYPALDSDLFCYEDDLPIDSAALPPLPPLFHPAQTHLQTPAPTQAPTPTWRSLLDDNCPLRKRVKVTITSTARKRLNRPPPCNTINLHNLHLSPVPTSHRTYPPPPRDLPIPTPTPTCRPVLRTGKCISSCLADKIRSVAKKKIEPPSCTRLPFVDVAIRAVTRAAEAYRNTLDSFAPEEVRAMVLPRRGKKRKRGKVSKRRRVRRKNVLLSFDDREVKPLEDISRAGGSALDIYLAAPPASIT